MSDLDQLDPRLDAAFEALTRDLAHTHGPGAAAAMTTARTRRRTKVGAVALATALVVGGGLTVPRLLFPTDGVAGNGGSAPLDASALESATRGWLTGWEPWDEGSPQALGSFSVSECFSSDDVKDKPEQVAGGWSRFLGDDDAFATAVFAEYPDAASAEAAQSGAFSDPSCRGGTTMTVDGTRVWHYSQAPTEVGTAVTDVWTVQIGAERLTLELGSRVGVAPAPAVEAVAQALVAGLRSGEVQEHYSSDPNVPDPNARPPLPEFPESTLTSSLDGWRAASRSVAGPAPCLSTEEDIGAASGLGGSTPRGVTWRVSGFEAEAEAEAWVSSAIDGLRACTSPSMTVETLSGGVTLATWGTGGPEGRGAVWLLAIGDRTGVVAVDGADRPMPSGVAEGVAQVLGDYLRLPWE